MTFSPIKLKWMPSAARSNDGMLFTRADASNCPWALAKRSQVGRNVMPGVVVATFGKTELMSTMPWR